MENALTLGGLLRAAQSVVAKRLALLCAMHVAGALSLSLVLAAITLMLWPARSLVAGLWIGTWFVGTLWALNRYLVVLWRRLKQPEAMAAWLDGAIAKAAVPDPPHLRSAYELMRDRGRRAESVALVDVAIDRTLRRARAHDPLSILRAELGRTVAKTSRGMLVLLIACVGVGVAFPGVYSTVVSSAVGRQAWQPGVVSQLGEPALGELRLSYRYPAYAEREPKTVASPTGHIRALIGTEVTIETWATERLANASLVLIFPGVEPLPVAAEVNSRRIKASMTVARPGQYRFDVTTERGEKQTERRAHAIEIEPDHAPKVELTVPTEDVIVVNDAARVPIEFRASDDYAIAEARIRWRVLETTREGRQPIALARKDAPWIDGKATFEIEAIKPSPGDRVAYFVEALDNDTVNGPKIGASRTKEIRVYSKDAHHREVLSQAEATVVELIHILGDEIEVPWERSVDERGRGELVAAIAGALDRKDKVQAQLATTIDALKNDPRGQRGVADAFSAAKTDLARDARRARHALRPMREAFERTKAFSDMGASVFRDASRVAVGNLEKHVVYLSDLLADQRLADARSLMKMLREEQDNLRRALERYKASPTPEERQALLLAIADIKRRMQEIAAELSKTRATIPSTIQGADGMESEMANRDIDRIQKAVEQGSFDRALDELDDMIKSTERLLSQTDQSQTELEAREYSEAAARVAQFEQQLEDLEKDQQALKERTEARARTVDQRIKNRIQNLDAFVARQVARVHEAEAILERVEKEQAQWVQEEASADDVVRQRLQDTRAALLLGDFGAAKEAVGLVLDGLTESQKDARQFLDRTSHFGDLFATQRDRLEARIRQSAAARAPIALVKKDLEALLPRPQTLLTSEERRGLDNMAVEQRAIEASTRRTLDMLDALAEDVPIVGEGTHDMLEQASEQMARAGGALLSGDAQAAASREREALRALERLKNALQELAQNRSGSGNAQGGGGRGVPMPFGARSQDGRDDDANDGTSLDSQHARRVEIPKPEQYKVPAEFREEILRAKKQPGIDAYREAVSRYYEEIVR